MDHPGQSLNKTNRKRRHPQQQSAAEQTCEDKENGQLATNNAEIDDADADGKVSTAKTTTDFRFFPNNFAFTTSDQFTVERKFAMNNWTWFHRHRTLCQ
jgi:hypothetical protein